MESIKKEAQIWFSLIVILLIWVSVLTLTSTPLSINWKAVEKLPHVVTIFVVVRFAFTRWMWRWKIFTYKGWLVRVPDIQGTWAGDLQSTWKNPKTGQGIPPLKMLLVIRQTFSTMSCTMFTKESESYSRAAQLAVEDESGAITVSYNYTNRSKAVIRDRSPIHDGAAHLRVVTLPQRMLEGEYWTGRCTTGTMKLHFRSKDLLEAFPD
jgi:predicted pore-forming effector associated with SMODS systems